MDRSSGVRRDTGRRGWGKIMPPVRQMDQLPRGVYGPRGRIIVDEVEAHDIMSLAYRSNATQLHQMAQQHHVEPNRIQRRASVIRPFADLLFRAGNMDPNTHMLFELKQSQNAQLRNTHYFQGGGFLVNERFTFNARRNTFSGSQRNIEFHPPGGRHDLAGEQNERDKHLAEHGSYIRPATQPNAPKPRDRTFSSGAIIPPNS